MWPTQVPMLRATIVVIAWIGMNFLLQYINKYMFNEENFRFPVLIIFTGTIVTFIGSFISVFVLRIETFDRRLIIPHWKLLLTVAFTYGFGTAFQNLSIEHISIPMNQVIKTTTPFMTMLTSMWLEKKRYGAGLVVSTLLQVAGAALVVFHNPSFDPVGFASALASSMCNVANLVLSAILMQRSKISPLILTLSTTLPAAFSILPLFYITEYAELKQESYELHTLLTLLFCSIAAYFYNIIHYLMINYTSSMYSSLISNVKVVVVVGLAMVVYPTESHFTLLNIFGLVLSLFGFCFYNYLRFLENRAKMVTLGRDQVEVELEPVSDFEQKTNESAL